MNGQRKRRRGAMPASLIVLALVVSSCGSSGQKSAAPTGAAPQSASTLAPIHGTYSPSIDAADFVATVDNRWFPLTPGTAFHYRGVRGATPQTDDEVVTHATKQILGIKCTVVRDTVSEHGVAIERTDDWYAQDKQGNVWYMGEDSFERQHGRFAKASDSWESGVDGAQPGIIMPARPKPGDSYRQEYYPPGKALDQAHVLRTNGTVTAPYGSFNGVLVTSEYSPLEPQTEHKYYAAGVGEIAERVVKGHHEAFELVSVKR